MAHISVKGTWMHLDERKPTQTPQALIDAIRSLSAGEIFEYGKTG
ncbi:MAG: hypothetical protein AAFZ63_24420 [Bacteroidota bacterium]